VVRVPVALRVSKGVIMPSLGRAAAPPPRVTALDAWTAAGAPCSP
jgi:hypothetical protein